MRRPVHTFRFFLLASLLLGGGSACSATPSYEVQRVEAARRLSAAIEERGVHTVAVLDFANVGDRLDGFGRFVALDLATELKDSAAGFSLCDRDAVEKALEEIQRGTTGLLAEDQSAELGKGCGAEAVVWGRHAVGARRIKITAKLIAVESQEVLASVRMEVPRSPDFDELLAIRLPGSGGGHSTTPARNLPQTARVGRLEVTLDACTFLESKLVCKLDVRNASSRSVTLEVLDGSSLVDNQSDRHWPEEVWFDGQSRSARPTLSSTLGAGRSAPLELDFATVPRLKKKAEMLEIGLGGAGPARFLDFAFDREPR